MIKAAVYVDNVVLLGCRRGILSGKIGRIKKALDDANLVTRDATEPVTEDTALGLEFDQNHISAGRGRVWTLRYALEELLRIGKCSAASRARQATLPAKAPSGV